jgi:acetylornithine deacetylase
MSDVADREILDAVAGVEDEMLDLLARLVEAPTTLGNEEPGQVLMEEAFHELAGLEPHDVPMDARALRAHPAVYEPARGAAEYRWPSFSWRQTFERFETGTRTISLEETSAA